MWGIAVAGSDIKLTKKTKLRFNQTLITRGAYILSTKKLVITSTAIANRSSYHRFKTANKCPNVRERVEMVERNNYALPSSRGNGRKV